MQKPMQNPEDSSDPTTAMNMALTLLAKAFKVNTIPTNNNQRSSLIARNSQIVQPVQNDGNEVGQNAVQNPGIQIVENMNGLSAVSEIANQYGNGNVVTAPAEGNDNGINGIQSTQEEFEFMTAADAHEETERVKVNCTSEDTLQQASKSRTQFDNAPVYDSDGSAEVPKDEDCYDHHLFNTLTQEVQYTDLQTELDPYNDMQTKIERLQAQLGDLKGKSSDTQCASNTIDPLSQKLEDENVSLEFQLYDTIYESYKLRAQLFDKVSEPKGTTKVLPKVDKTNALSKPVTSNSAPSTQELKVVQTIIVIAPRFFRTNPSKNSRVDIIVPNKPVKTSYRIKPITVSQLNIIHKQQANSDSNGFSSTRVNNIAKTRRPHPRSNSNTDWVPSKSKSSCL
ncbi:hypothetical protein Tco_0468651 [Tanacetum coccineum]